MEMEQPQMELVGTISSMTRILPSLDQAEPNVCVGNQLTMLNIAGSNGNRSIDIDPESEKSPSYEVVDALSFFGKKDKSPEKGNVMKMDDGDSRGFWGGGGGTKAAMPVEMDSEVYNMNHPKRGRALILNHENFLSHLDLGQRHGTEKDKANLVATCKKLGFDVSAYDDLTHTEVVDVIQKLTKEDHSRNDCLLIAVLSHGDHQILYAKDFSYKPDQLWQSFTGEKCPSLAGKPKIFLVQACQGSQLDSGVKLVKVNHSRTETDSSPSSYRIPNHADFMIAFSTVPGYYSWRNTTNGSWFMQAVCDVFKKYASKKDLMSMMTVVNRMVAISFESNTPSQPHMNQMKQMPFITSTLIRDVYLTPK